MNGNFDLKDDDVLAFPKDVLGWKLGTDKVKNALDEIKRIPTMRDGGEFIAHLWEKGVECEYLSVMVVAGPKGS